MGIMGPGFSSTSGPHLELVILVPLWPHPDVVTLVPTWISPEPVTLVTLWDSPGAGNTGPQLGLNNTW